MTVDFLDNQNINSEELNNVAIDLGITFDHFSNDTNYAVTELNEITKAIVNAGVLSNGGQCKVTTGTVADGIIVFASGAKGRLSTSESYDVPSGAHYVYAIYDEDDNTAKIDTGSSLPTGEDYVPLAYVGANGKINDRRKFASAKMGTTNQTRELSVDIQLTYNSASETDCGTVNLGFTPSFVMFNLSASTIRTTRLSSGNYVAINTYNDGGTGVQVWFKIEGTSVHVKAKHTGTTGTTTTTKTFIFV